MAKYKKQGLVKSVGISTYTPKETIQAIENDVWDVVQLPFNLMDQRHGEFFNLAAQNGTAIVVRSALFKGILTEKGQNLHPALKSVEEHRNAYKLLSEKTGLNLSDLATKFVLSYNQVSSVLVGIDRMQYLQKALYVADGKYFDRNLLSEIQDLAYPEPEFLNLRKWNSKGWLK
jgi:aryl-alcohol dehydrogenase-like predicted oxidoreductase